LIKRKGAIVHREAKTFDRKQAAKGWLTRQEAEVAKPDGLEKGEDPLLSVAIDRYIRESKKKIGRTKTQVLRTIKSLPIAEMKCSEIKSQDIVDLAQSIDAKPQTVQNYLSHLGAIFGVARPAWISAESRRHKGCVCCYETLGHNQQE
jgi:hypothetical protein